jgi:hypothetical protein
MGASQGSPDPIEESNPGKLDDRPGKIIEF